MNLVGKIFVLLIFIMSLVFMAFSVAVYATHKNWKSVIENPKEAQGGPGLKVLIADAKAENEKLQKEMTEKTEELNLELSRRQEALNKAEAARKELETRANELRAERDTLVTNEKESLAKLVTTHEHLETLTKEVNGLRDEIRVAQEERDRHFDKVLRLTDQVQQTDGDKKRLEERQAQLVSQVAAQKKVLAAYDLNEFTPVDKRAPMVEGKVLAVNQNDMVELSIGSDDGMKAGHTLDVFRATSYLGKVEVLTTSTDRAVGKILPSYKKGIIQRGDNVTTRFKTN